MVAIVRYFGFPATELQNLSRVPSTDELRPVQCPSCGVAAGPPGALRLVGHGRYRRQLLGLPDAPEGVVIFVRRFLCLACRKTASILPEEVHPRRWYAGAAILAALVRYLILGWSAEKVRVSWLGVSNPLAVRLSGPTVATTPST
jgi:branched-subunit amino acid transport protein